MLSAPVPARSLSSSGVLKAENRTEARSRRCKKEKVNPTSLTWLWSVLIFVSLTEDRPHHRVTGCRGLTFIYLNTLARETVSI